MTVRNSLRHLCELAARAPADGRPPASLPRFLLRSLREDAVTIRNQFVRNSIAGSVIVPRVLRWLIYRVSGLHIDTPKVREECRMNNSFLSIASGASVNRACYFEGSGAISIGARSSIGPECAFITSYHRRRDDGTLLGPVNLPISIGSRVWVGARATFLPGAVVEDDCVIAAGAVVSGRCLADRVYGGVPARFLHERRPAEATAFGPDPTGSVVPRPGPAPRNGANGAPGVD